ncbi:MAG: hypothetical protein ACHQ2E_09840 [Gemmatimonadales bacterium]
MPFLDRARVIALLDTSADSALDFGARVVLDQILTLTLSFVFLHHGLGLTN